MPKSITIAGTSFPLPSAEETGIVAGYVLDEASAKHLYQSRCERIRNNLTPIIRKMKDKGLGTDEISDYVAKYAKDYKFSLLGRSATTSGAADKRLEDEQYSIARDYIRQYLAEQGRKPSDIPDGLSQADWDEKLQANVERVANNPDTIRLAKKRLAERRKAGATLLEGVAL